MVTFHRVGQGLFASEKYRAHTIVYDCGGERIKIVNNAIDSGLSEIPDIDILFISHYDRDHINGIFHLLEKHKVKHVILPLVSDFSRYLSFRSFMGHKSDTRKQFYSDPASFIHSISPQSICHYLRDANVSIGGNIINLGNLPEVIDSNVQILLLNDWFLIPYNRKVLTRKQEREFLSGLGLDPDLGFNQIKEKWQSIDKCIKRKFIEAGIVNRYNINDYSMTLYSQNQESRTLYLGDYNANMYCDELKTVYCVFWQNISCLQVPHHGSEKSFNDELLECGADDYVISNNREPKSSKKVDPRPVTDKIKKKGKMPHITDDGLVELL